MLVQVSLLFNCSWATVKTQTDVLPGELILKLFMGDRQDTGARPEKLIIQVELPTLVLQFQA
jgi:hypothetical protein